MKNEKKNNMIKTEEKLEKEIIQNIYNFESKRTSRSVLFYTIVIICLFLLITISSRLLYEILNEQQTLDLLNIFQEDFEIIKENISNIIDTFWEESPQTLIFIILFFIMAFLTTLYLVTSNFKKIKNRIFAAKKYFEHNKKNG